MKRLTLLALFALAACATKPAEPKIVTRDVPIPIRQSCVPKSVADEPIYPVTIPEIIAMPGPDRLQAITALLLLYKARNGVLEPVVRGCR